MSTAMRQFAGFAVSLGTGWDEITSSLDDEAAPVTLANPDSGFGALQFSVAKYKAGPLPSVTERDLCAMVDSFALSRGLECPFDRRVSVAVLTAVGESFRSGTDFVRVWYASDGKNVALITYVCGWDDREHEADVAEAIVQSLRFR